MAYGNMNKYRKNKRSNSNQNQDETFKKSGFEVKYLTDGKNKGLPICWGWRKTRLGIQKLYARPYKKTKVWKGASGKTHVSLFVTLTSDAGETRTTGFFCKETGKLSLKSMGLVGSTNGGGKTAGGKMSKGFFGKIR